MGRAGVHAAGRAWEHTRRSRLCRGGVGIADAGRDSGGSQWFVMHSRAAHLDGRYTWVGSVANAGKVADALVIGDEIVKASVVVE